ncbi:MAG TPA: hypothetical protein VF226_13435 [Hyphomicrobiaceae bacterium]
MLPTLHAKSPKVPQLELFQKLEQYASIRLGNLTTGHRRVNDRGVQQQKETAKIALKRDTEVRTISAVPQQVCAMDAGNEKAAPVGRLLQEMVLPVRIERTTSPFIAPALSRPPLAAFVRWTIPSS